jgi:hypothetical protein
MPVQAPDLARKRVELVVAAEILHDAFRVRPLIEVWGFERAARLRDEREAKRHGKAPQGRWRAAVFGRRDSSGHSCEYRVARRIWAP